ncbi:hypothetical protein BpHYR1_043156 [Brachionus plicatilis]|uniref:Uncharacterized protein n=1 Tax=Brachionus plicatilis TaxID=10195 RepID=A0A3M7RPA8_BRAPC|nr:hypothetical protein BpHYR1_043156 [Brachionus plicatilis]
MFSDIKDFLKTRRNEISFFLTKKKFLFEKLEFFGRQHFFNETNNVSFNSLIRLDNNNCGCGVTSKYFCQKI